MIIELETYRYWSVKNFHNQPGMQETERGYYLPGHGLIEELTLPTQFKQRVFRLVGQPLHLVIEHCQIVLLPDVDRLVLAVSQPLVQGISYSDFDQIVSRVWPPIQSGDANLNMVVCRFYAWLEQELKGVVSALPAIFSDKFSPEESRNSLASLADHLLEGYQRKQMAHLN